ncbi:MAG: glutamate--tRNA ligase [Planctomycetaceae bacterium]|nr:glutamate--tRNA ligase [Planctomycetaceae bacterium]
MTSSVRTRFAPSPTGYMHIGGMRTALFNWLWARRHGGQFILRIDDTDQQRNMEEALNPILDAFRWLGLDWDEGPDVGGPFGPYFQSQRRPLYDAALQQLLSSGHAYRDFETAEESQQQRDAASREKRVYISSRASLELTVDEIRTRLEQGVPHVIRLLIPRDQKVRIQDHIRGEVEWDCALMPDPVIARADGSPLYNFATVVDDAHLQITHVIRAEEHLSNTPIQVLIHQALGNPLPEWAHIPYVAAPGGKEKLSKRKIAGYRNNPQFRKLFELGDAVLSRIGIDATADSLSPVMVEYYRRVGFIPQGVLNALARLGWSLDDHTEIMSLEMIRQNFSLDRVIKSAAGLDADKLLNFQAHWMQQLPTEQKVAGCLAWLQEAGLVPDDADEESRRRVARVVELAGERLRVFGDIFQMDEFFVQDDQFTWDEKNFQKRVVRPDTALDILRSLREQLSDLASFDAESLHLLVQNFVSERELKAGDVFPVLRLCVTGKAQGADLFQTLELIGRDSVLKRIDRSVGVAESQRA